MTPLYLPEAAGAKREWGVGCVFGAAGAAALPSSGRPGGAVLEGPERPLLRRGCVLLPPDVHWSEREGGGGIRGEGRARLQ